MEAVTDSGQSDSVWEQLSPILDDAMAQLRDKDRDAIVLRFFENKSLREVGLALGVEERAAQKRVARSLQRLRSFFSKRGISTTTAIVSGAMAANSVHASPASLAKTISTVALAQGAAASISTLTLVKGALKIMAWTKAKTAIVASAVVLLTAGTTTVVVGKAITHANSIVKQRLADGSLLILNRASFGSKHEYVEGGKKKSWNSPGNDDLSVEFRLTGKNAANQALVRPAFYRQFRCVLHGERGIEYVEEFWRNNFQEYSHDFYGYIYTSMFPRASRWLWFRIEQRDDRERYDSWHTVAEFKIANPARPANFKWSANPAPTTNAVQGMDFVLGKITVKTVPNYPHDIWNHVVTVPTEVWDNGVLLTNWAAVYVHMEDASGNWNRILQTHRSLDPDYVWKLDADFEPESNFPSESLAVVDLPERSSTITTNVMGVPVTIAWDGNWVDASMPANRSDLALKFVSVTDDQGEDARDGSGSWGQHQFRKGSFMVQKGGVMTMDVKPTKMTFAIVPNVHTTFYAQPQLVAEAVKN